MTARPRRLSIAVRGDSLVSSGEGVPAERGLRASEGSLITIWTKPK